MEKVIDESIKPCPFCGLRPTHLIVTLSADAQDARDLYSEPRLTCAGCGRNNRQVPAWVLPGLCSECALRVEAVTVAAPRQQAMFDMSRMPS